MLKLLFYYIRIQVFLEKTNQILVNVLDYMYATAQKYRHIFKLLLSYLIKILQYFTSLMGGNWQKWKRVFLTCPCRKIHRDEAVGLKNLWKWEIWGSIVKIWYFVNNFLIEARIKKFFCTCVTHITVISWSTARYIST